MNVLENNRPMKKLLLIGVDKPNTRLFFFIVVSVFLLLSTTYESVKCSMFERCGENSAMIVLVECFTPVIQSAPLSSLRSMQRSSFVSSFFLSVTKEPDSTSPSSMHPLCYKELVTDLKSSTSDHTDRTESNFNENDCNNKSKGKSIALDEGLIIFDDDAADRTAFKSSTKRSTLIALTKTSLLVITALVPFTANAAADVSSVIPSALIAYSHYLAMLVTLGLLLYERLTVEAGMSSDAEKKVVIADALYGLSALALFVSGYFRAVEYGKGWEFYSHEILFWVKLSMASILAGLSAFPTITFIKRGSKIFQGKESELEPMTEKLATRITKVINAEISAILFIPLFASLMARGVWYNNDFPWQAGAALVTVSLIGSAVFYGKSALTWTEDETKIPNE